MLFYVFLFDIWLKDVFFRVWGFRFIIVCRGFSILNMFFIFFFLKYKRDVFFRFLCYILCQRMVIRISFLFIWIKEGKERSIKDKLNLGRFGLEKQEVFFLVVRRIMQYCREEEKIILFKIFGQVIRVSDLLLWFVGLGCYCVYICFLEFCWLRCDGLWWWIQKLQLRGR